MKNFLILAILFSFNLCFTQVPTMYDVETKKVKGKLTSVELKNGVILRLGDKLTIGLTPYGRKDYNYVTQNMLCTGSGGYGPPAPCNAGYFSMPTHAAGASVEIRNIRAMHGKAVISASAVPGMVYGTRIVDLSSAIESGEISIPGFISSEAALSELKKYKDKLDFNLITQEEYDSVKTVLSKYIK